VNFEWRTWYLLDIKKQLIGGGMLPEILQALTRYSANGPKFPVNNDRRVFSR
jgi:hypothetical protein